MAGYKTVKTWSAPDISFDENGKRIKREQELACYEVCHAPPAVSPNGDCVKRCGQRCEWSGRNV